jgi:serine protease
MNMGFPMRFRVLVQSAALVVASTFAAVAMAAAAPERGDTRGQSLLERTGPSPASLRRGSNTTIEVKFRNGVAVQNGRIAAKTARTAEFGALENLLIGNGVAGITPLFDAQTVRKVAARKSVGDEAGQPLADLQQWHHLRVAPGTDVAALVKKLKAQKLVEHAYPAPLPAPPSTPDYRPWQYYLNGRDLNGIDVDFAHTVDGARGHMIQIADVEYDWNRNHEDLSKLRAPGAFIANGTPAPIYGSDHGTAVMGILGADNNGFGVTGIVPRVTLRMVNANTTAGYNPSNAILRAANALNAGDVILIEQQTYAPAACGGGFVPLEYIPAVFDATRVAVRKGIHVVAAAGNGNVSLNNPACFGQPFPRGANSGAIIVGAGTANCSSMPRSRMYFSSYGSRVNVHGWGQCVVTTAYGDMQGGADINRWYTRGFSGTSSASPIVAGAVAALSGVARVRGLSLTPYEMRLLLMETGIPQVDPANGWIGPLPNLRRAINNINTYAAIQ